MSFSLRLRLPRILMRQKSTTSKSQSSSSSNSPIPSLLNGCPALRYEPAKEKNIFDLYIQLHVKPGAKQDQLISVHEDAVEVQISAPPTDGEANKGIVQYFARILSVPKSDITLVRGHKSRDKTILVKYQVKNAAEQEKLLQSIMTSLKNNSKLT